MLGDPSNPLSVAASRFDSVPGSQPVGMNTGAQPPTELRTFVVPPMPQQAAVVAYASMRANRFITLTAPKLTGPFSVYIGMTEAVNGSNGHALPPGLPYEITLPGDQVLYAITDSPVAVRLAVQVAIAVSGDRERTRG